MKSFRAAALSLSVIALGFVSFGCNNTNNAGSAPDDKSAAAPGGADSKGADALSGTIALDGSSTVSPISEAIAEEFQKAHPGVRVTVGVSGTGGGFKKFGNGETDISDASRPIKKSEEEAAAAKSIAYVELPIAYDGLSVVVNPANKFATCLTIAEMKKIWEPGSKINNWSQVRAGFPSQPIKLYGPGTDSGTFDYFTEAVNGKQGASRSDYTASEDDNTLVTGIAGDVNAMGYFGYAYYQENKEKIKLVGVDGGKGCIEPSPETIVAGTYQPLSRPLFLYVSTKAADRPEVKEFVKFYLSEGRKLIKTVGYVPLPDKAYELAQKRFDDKKTGSLFTGGSQIGVKIEDLLKAEEGKAR